MTVEAWVFPTAVSSAWRDVVVKGNDDYYLMATSSNASRPVYGQYFAGRIDEVRIYNTALSAAQIQTDMTTPIDHSPPEARRAPLDPVGDAGARATCVASCRAQWPNAEIGDTVPLRASPFGSDGRTEGAWNSGSLDPWRP